MGVGTLTLVLGLVHGGIGVLKQGATVVGVCREDRNPDTCRHEYFLAIQYVRRCERLENTFCNLR